MRLLRDCPLALLLVMTALAPAEAGDLALKRVTLSSGGVGYFEYEASVDGDTTLALEVPLDQVDDLLKSLVVYDTSGRAGTITLPGREPLAQSFADLPFDQSALASMTGLLNALQGSEVRLGQGEPIIGQLVHAEDVIERGQDGVSATLTRVGVLTQHGLRQATVRDFDAVEFTDPALQAKVGTALNRVAAYRAQGRRQLVIATHGNGQRTVRVGYVVAMPLWKASYRMVLPADANAAAARLQGWAVLENFSGQNWADVELTLLSGNPVTFRQALYESYYVPRPVVPVESGNHVLPPPDSGSFADERSKATENTAPATTPKQFANRAMPAGTITPAAAPAPAPPPVSEPAQIDAAAAAENSTQTAFTLPSKISVAAGQSLVVPLIDREVPTRRIDLYQPATSQSHPLAALELTNAADTGLPPGVLTLYQQGDRGAEYLGDARLGATPSGQKRLLNYAVDEKVTVAQDTATRQSIVKATIAEGVMHLTRLQRRTTVYTVSSAAAPPALVIEQRKLGGGWQLTAPDNAERTTGAYRIPAALDAKGNTTVTIVEEQPRDESIQLADLGDEQLGAYVSAQEIDPKLRQALGELAQRRQHASRTQAELDRLDQQHARLTEDEQRLRDNYTALKDDPDMRKSTLDRLKATDTAIDDNAAATAKAKAALIAAQADLAAYIGGLNR